MAAGSPGTHWALNLLDRSALPDRARRCRLGRDRPLLEGPAACEAAIRDLILRYGTPAENLGSGPAFELTPVTEATAT